MLQSGGRPGVLRAFETRVLGLSSQQPLSVAGTQAVNPKAEYRADFDLAQMCTLQTI